MLKCQTCLYIGVFMFLWFSSWRAIIDHLMTHDKTTFRDLMSKLHLFFISFYTEVHVPWLISAIVYLVSFNPSLQAEWNQDAHVMLMTARVSFSSCCRRSEQLSESVHQPRRWAGAEGHAAKTSGLHRLQQRSGPVPEVPARHTR